MNKGRYLIMGTNENNDVVLCDEFETIYLAVRSILSDDLYMAKNLFIAKRIDWNVVEEDVHPLDLMDDISLVTPSANTN